MKKKINLSVYRINDWLNSSVSGSYLKDTTNDALVTGNGSSFQIRGAETRPTCMCMSITISSKPTVSHITRWPACRRSLAIRLASSTVLGAVGIHKLTLYDSWTEVTARMRTAHVGFDHAVSSLLGRSVTMATVRCCGPSHVPAQLHYWHVLHQIFRRNDRQRDRDRIMSASPTRRCQIELMSHGLRLGRLIIQTPARPPQQRVAVEYYTRWKMSRAQCRRFSIMSLL